MIGLMARIPLREKHWCLMTYSKDNTGTLRKDAVNGWQIVIPIEEFKNYSNTKIFGSLGRDSEVILDIQHEEAFGGFISDIEFYINNIRSVLDTADGFLFPSRRDSKGLTPPGVNSAVFGWTGRWLAQNSYTGLRIRGVHAFGPHAFRDICATHLIKVTGSIEIAAYALLDNVDTVRKHYTRFLPKDRLKHVFNALKDVFES